MTALEKLASDMRCAADAIEAANKHIGNAPNICWHPSELRGEAEHVLAEANEAAKREAQVEELGQDLFSIIWPSFRWNLSTDVVRDFARHYARALLECGWRKEDQS